MTTQKEGHMERQLAFYFSTEGPSAARRHRVIGKTQPEAVAMLGQRATYLGWSLTHEYEPRKS